MRAWYGMERHAYSLLAQLLIIFCSAGPFFIFASSLSPPPPALPRYTFAGVSSLLALCYFLWGLCLRSKKLREHLEPDRKGESLPLLFATGRAP